MSEQNGHEHLWISPEEGEEHVISEVEMGDYKVIAYKVAESALSENANDGYEIIPVSSKSSTVIISSSFIESIIHSSPGPVHGAYTFGVFIGQTLTVELMRLVNNEEHQE